MKIKTSTVLTAEDRKNSKQNRQQQVAETAIRIFLEKGYEQSTVDEIAAAADISRRTFFRQFKSKEDVIFVDHDIVIAEITELLAKPAVDPWIAVLDSAGKVFQHFVTKLEFSKLRYQLVREVPQLRDRELATSFRYERLYANHLRSGLSESLQLRAIVFASSVTAGHNYLLRKVLRGEAQDPIAFASEKFVEIANLYGLDYNIDMALSAMSD